MGAIEDGLVQTRTIWIPGGEEGGICYLESRQRCPDDSSRSRSRPVVLFQTQPEHHYDPPPLPSSQTGDHDSSSLPGRTGVPLASPPPPQNGQPVPVSLPALLFFPLWEDTPPQEWSCEAQCRSPRNAYSRWFPFSCWLDRSIGNGIL